MEKNLFLKQQQVATEIQRLMTVYDSLPPDVRKEVVRFISNPTITAQLKVKSREFFKQKNERGSNLYLMI